MKRSVRRVVLLGVGLLGLALVGCESDQQAVTEEPARVVKLTQVGEQSLLPGRRFVGRVEAVSTVDLSFRVGGQLVEVPSQQGGVIPQGGVVARLDPTDYELAERRADAEYRLALRELERSRQLLDNNSISQSAFDEIRTRYELAEVQRDSARQELSYSVIEAPFDARITRRLVENHSNVQPGTAIVRVQDVTELRVAINVPETLVRHLTNPERFQVEAELLALPGERFALEYREHVTEPDSVAQTYEVDFAIVDPAASSAMPGMTVSVHVALADGVDYGAMLIPSSALDSDGEGSFRVWVYDAESRQVESRSVEVGEIQGEAVPVLSGLQRGEHIVAAGAHLLHEGQRVRPLKASL